MEEDDWWRATKDGKVAVVRGFIEVGRRDLEGKDGCGWLHHSVLGGVLPVQLYGHLEVVTVLVQAGT